MTTPWQFQLLKSNRNCQRGEAPYSSPLLNIDGHEDHVNAAPRRKKLRNGSDQGRYQPRRCLRHKRTQAWHGELWGQLPQRLAACKAPGKEHYFLNGGAGEAITMPFNHSSRLARRTSFLKVFCPVRCSHVTHCQPITELFARIGSRLLSVNVSKPLCREQEPKRDVEVFF